MQRERPPQKQRSTSWEPVGKWYQNAVGDDGHYYHQKIVIPGVLRLLNLDKKQNVELLDLACGQGVLARHLPETFLYTGIDLSTTLIKAAKKIDLNPRHKYIVSDVTKPLPLGNKESVFSHAAIILALQNIEQPDFVLRNLFPHLKQGGKLVIVLNHPCFRIPRQSSWQVDQEKKIQYRRVDRYLTELKIPIQAHPSKGEQSAETWTFHHPLSSFSRWLHEAGFAITLMEEWCSDKVSTGGAAKMENRSREEFPLFLTIVAEKRVSVA